MPPFPSDARNGSADPRPGGLAALHPLTVADARAAQRHAAEIGRARVAVPAGGPCEAVGHLVTLTAAAEQLDRTPDAFGAASVATLAAAAAIRLLVDALEDRSRQLGRPVDRWLQQAAELAVAAVDPAGTLAELLRGCTTADLVRLAHQHVTSESAGCGPTATLDDLSVAIGLLTAVFLLAYLRHGASNGGGARPVRPRQRPRPPVARPPAPRTSEPRWRSSADGGRPAVIARPAPDPREAFELLLIPALLLALVTAVAAVVVL